MPGMSKFDLIYDRLLEASFDELCDLAVEFEIDNQWFDDENVRRFARKIAKCAITEGWSLSDLEDYL